METQYISSADTAKMIRQSLKESFPCVKFSVRSNTYSGGSSISISWTDGPNKTQVEAVTDAFEGAYFDGMTDYKGSRYSMIDGKVVRFGVDFIFYNRDYSDSTIQRVIDRFYTKFIENFKQRGADKPTVEQFKHGICWSVQIFGEGMPYSENLQADINKMLAKSSDRLKVSPSKIAGRVIYLGNDGYSQVGALTQLAE